MKSRPLRPTASNADVLVFEVLQNFVAAFSTLELNAPASPRSPVTRTSRTFFSGRCASSGCLGSPVFWIDEIGALHHRLQNVGEHLRVGPRRQRALLRAPQLGRRHHLHGLGDLPRVLHAADAPPNVAYVRHGSNQNSFVPGTTSVVPPSAPILLGAGFSRRQTGTSPQCVAAPRLLVPKRPSPARLKSCPDTKRAQT